jgi:hypothetical protein
VRNEIAEAIRAALPEHRTPGLIAALAVRLAQVGYAEAVSVKVAGSSEAVQAVRSFFAERFALDGDPAPARQPDAVEPPREAAEAPTEALEADPPEIAPESALTLRPQKRESDAPASVQGPPVNVHVEGSERPQACPSGETRECRVCGVPFTVNRRHARRHTYCSAACRSRARHRRNKGLSESAGGGDETATPAPSVYRRDGRDYRAGDTLPNGRPVLEVTDGVPTLGKRTHD